jgi:nitrile hydratase subunit beta
MKLQHYLGGLEGLDEVDLETRVFVEEWERRIFGIHVAMMALSAHLSAALPSYPMEDVPTTFASEWTWADLRKGAEAMSPLAYFQYRYYEKWLGGISQYLIDHGYVSGDELDERTGARQDEAHSALSPEQSKAVDAQVLRYLRRGDSPRRGPADDPQFAVGDRVTVRDVPATDHTRLPGYLRGRTGTVVRVFEGRYAYFCSTGADGLGPPMPVYAVRFDPRDIWGEMAEQGSTIHGELYEVYLEPDKETVR